MASAETSVPGPSSRHSPRRVAFASFIGTTIEWYDFFIYGIAATLVFGTAFFPQFSELGGSLAALSTFAVGFIARPVGGIVMGHFGDRVGRKSMLVVSLLTMGLATTLIGLLPTYDSIGIWAPVLLVALRLAQGVGVGGEWGGAVLMSIEHAPRERRSLYGCLPQLGLPTGIFVSQLVFLLLSSSMSPDSFVAWGWRVPFLISSVLIVVGLAIRLTIEESIDFQRVRQVGAIAKTPLVEVFRTSARQLAVGGLASVASPAIGYFWSVSLIAYGTTALGLSTTTMLYIVVGLSVPQIAMLLGGGAAGDRFDRKPTFVAGAALAVVWAVPMALLIDTAQVVWIIVGLVPIVLANAIMAGSQPALVTEMFPTRVRYSGASLCYQFGSIIGGGIVPLVTTALLARFGTATSVGLLIAGVSAVSLAAVVPVGRKFLRAGALADSMGPGPSAGLAGAQGVAVDK
jgi:MFS family permease